MRGLIQKFREKKAMFPDPNEPDIRFDLSEPLATLSIKDRINEGELTIYRSATAQLSCADTS